MAASWVESSTNRIGLADGVELNVFQFFLEDEKQ